MTVQEQITTQLTKDGWLQTSDILFTKDMSKVVGTINGQPIQQSVVLEIEYLGQGSFVNAGEEDEPIFGYRIGNTDFWFLDFDDFMSVYQRI